MFLEINSLIISRLVLILTTLAVLVVVFFVTNTQVADGITGC